MKHSTFTVLSLCALLLTSALLLSGCVGSASIDPFDYISVTFSGYDTNGEAEVDFQKVALIEALIMDKIGKNSDAGAWLLQYDFYDRNITLDYTPESGLSNGDKVRVSVAVSKDVRKEVKSREKEYTVSGLPKVQPVDIFKDIALEYNGIGDMARANVKLLSDSELLHACRFTVAPEYGVRNGDTVTVTLQNPEQLANKFLCLPVETVKDFTASGVYEYLTDPDFLTEDQIREIIQRHLEDTQPKDDGWFSYSTPQYYKTLFLTAQPDSWFTDENRLEIYICYDEYLDGEFRQTNYIPIVFCDLILSPDGEVELTYEDGVSAVFYTDPESILARVGYDVEEIYIEY